MRAIIESVQNEIIVENDTSLKHEEKWGVVWHARVTGKSLEIIFLCFQAHGALLVISVQLSLFIVFLRLKGWIRPRHCCCSICFFFHYVLSDVFSKSFVLFVVLGSIYPEYMTGSPLINTVECSGLESVVVIDLNHLSTWQSCLLSQAEPHAGERRWVRRWRVTVTFMHSSHFVIFWLLNWLAMMEPFVVNIM